MILIPLAGCWGPGAEEAKEFKKSIQGATVTVYPAVVRTGDSVVHDAASAAALAEVLTRAGAREVRVSGERPALSDKRSFNQSAMFRASMAAFGEWVKAHPPKTDFAVTAEYLTSSNGAVGGIHLYGVRADGARVYAILLNSHHDLFKRADPRSTEQAANVLVAAVHEDLVK
jgi:hypothetical protein